MIELPDRSKRESYFMQKRYLSQKHRKLRYDHELQQLLHEVWFRWRRSRKDKYYIGDCYAEAFSEFVKKNPVPRKAFSKIKRTCIVLRLPNSAVSSLQAMSKI